MTHRVVVKLIRNTLAAVILGFATTCAVSALLGAALPHRNLLRHLQFASVHDFSSPVVEVERFTRTGMERRFWRVHEFGTHYGPSPLWNSYRTIPEPADGRDIDMPAAALWGGVGRVVAQRAERGSGTEDARGWPALAFWCELVAAPHPRPSSVRANGGISLSATDGSVSIGAFRIPSHLARRRARHRFLRRTLDDPNPRHAAHETALSPPPRRLPVMRLRPPLRLDPRLPRMRLAAHTLRTLIRGCPARWV